MAIEKKIKSKKVKKMQSFQNDDGTFYTKEVDFIEPVEKVNPDNVLSMLFNGTDYVYQLKE